MLVKELRKLVTEVTNEFPQERDVIIENGGPRFMINAIIKSVPTDDKQYKYVALMNLVQNRLEAEQIVADILGVAVDHVMPRELEGILDLSVLAFKEVHGKEALARLRPERIVRGLMNGPPPGLEDDLDAWVLCSYFNAFRDQCLNYITNKIKDAADDYGIDPSLN